MGKIPDRWLEYTRIGKPIERVPIIAFKTPIQRNDPNQQNNQPGGIQKEDEFTPYDLCNQIWDDGLDLAVVIDLTNTFRYYNGEFFCEQRIQYEKLKCEGRIVPDDCVIDRVTRILNDVIFRHGRDSKRLVGIHCTHGVNRTGYVVCRYLIQSLGFNPVDAIQMFNISRGHKMEREDYITDLMNFEPQFLYRSWETYVLGFNGWKFNKFRFKRDNRFIEERRKRKSESNDNLQIKKPNDDTEYNNDGTEKSFNSTANNPNDSLQDDKHPSKSTNDDKKFVSAKSKSNESENFVENVSLDFFQEDFYCDGN
uniref:RNA/RNP complex-1-interacting phosphatase n=1 Tax=Hydra vulgaris TaxID=6087 RepID=T2MIP3_HYDVU